MKELYTYQYDHAGRLITTTHKLDDKPEVILAQNTYDELGRLQKTKANNDQQLETTYTYNVRSWVNAIKSNHYQQYLDYTYGGNVSQFVWLGTNMYHRYEFEYDKLSRLIYADHEGGGYESYGTSYSYDKHGNIKSLQRYGKLGNGDKDYGSIDDLSITYKGNQMFAVTDTATDPLLSTSYDFKDYSNGNGSYIYNKNGAMVFDPSKGVTTTYDHNNMPKKIRVDNPITKGDIEYIYSASGQKLQTAYYTDRKIAIKPRPTIPGVEVGIRNGVTVGKLRELSEIIDYTGNKVYKTHKVRLRNVTELDKILIDNGYIQDGIYYFYQKDHLGNNRIVANQNGEVVQRNSYYPFGMPFAENIGTEKQPYKFGGKEFDTMHGLNLYDVHARQYDAATIRFTTVDPMAEKYYNISPYVYCANNPLRFIDPDGQAIGDVVRGFKQGFVGKFQAIGNAIANPGQTVSNWATAQTNKSFGDRMLDAVDNVTMGSLSTTVETGKALHTDLIGGGDGSSTGKVIGGQAAEATIAVGTTKAGQALSRVMKEAGMIGNTVSKVEVKVTAVVKAETNFVVTSKGEAIAIPKGASGPTNPQRGSGTVYTGGKGGHGMNDRVTGVRIMEANKNQGQKVNYMNSSGQTVDPKTGRTISNNDPRGHTPLKSD